MLKKRVITALWGVPLLIAVVWFGEPWFTVLMAVWGMLAVFEFYQMVTAAKVPPFTFFGIIWTLLFVLSPRFDYDFLIPLLLTSAVILPLFWFLRRPQNERAFIGWAWTIAGILYIGWLLSHLVALRGLTNGQAWVFFVLFTTFGSDTTAFFIGQTIGRHHLAPNVSPSKTWEGAIAGILGAIGISLLFTLFTPLHLQFLSYGQAILLGLLVSVFGQLGDLAESLLKRNMNVKDSGKLVPGHGGFLDRLDSILFASVVVYYYVIFIIL